MTAYFYLGFLVLILGLLAIDLGLLNRKARVISFRKALMWTSVWVSLGVGFSAVVYFLYESAWMIPGPYTVTGGTEAALEYLAAYLLEESMSLDNMFVIAIIFAYYGIAREHQHRVLFWGILGALVMRGAMISAGVVLIHRFDWITYVFGAILLLTALKLMVTGDHTFDGEHSLTVRFVRKFFTVTPTLDGSRFFTTWNGKRALTPLFLVLVLVEITDVIFAVDSIPAVFAITQDPFLVFTSNVFAILGLRSLYFVLADVMHRFRFLKMSFVVLLFFVAAKMLAVHHLEVPTPVSLAVIAAVVALGILASQLWPAKK